MRKKPDYSHLTEEQKAARYKQICDAAAKGRAAQAEKKRKAAEEARAKENSGATMSNPSLPSASNTERSKLFTVQRVPPPSKPTAQTLELPRVPSSLPLSTKRSREPSHSPVSNKRPKVVKHANPTASQDNPSFTQLVGRNAMAFGASFIVIAALQIGKFILAPRGALQQNDASVFNPNNVPLRATTSSSPGQLYGQSLFQ